jgi:hypothetical protein
LALRLPDGTRYGVALTVAGAGCPCEQGRTECVWAPVFSGPVEYETGLGHWLDLAENLAS